MRGGKSLTDRGVIPRLLSGIFRRSRRIERETEGATKIALSMSYYEIYNDKIFDLFEPPEKRTPSGLPLRDNGGKTVVVGLSERPCTGLKEFEMLYDRANVNRSTSETKVPKIPFFFIRPVLGLTLRIYNSSMPTLQDPMPYSVLNWLLPQEIVHELARLPRSIWLALKTIVGQKMARSEWSSLQVSIRACSCWLNVWRRCRKSRPGYLIANPK